MEEYTFSSFKDFFEFNLKKYSHDSDGNKILTLNDLSKKLGYKSSSLLSMIATGKRLPSNAIMENLFDEWNVDNSQREIIRLKLEIEKRIKNNRPAVNLIEKLSKKDLKSKYQTIDMDVFNSIKDWHNLVIQMLISTPTFEENYTKISYQLKRKVTPAEVRKGIETLVRSGLVKRNSKTGELSLADTESRNETTHDIPSVAIREHHKSMMARAIEAVDEGSVHDRHLNSLTLKFNKENKDEAKNFILNFVKEFNEKFHDTESIDIHQLNVQFFEHTNYSNKFSNTKEYIQ